jgi:transposase
MLKKQDFVVKGKRVFVGLEDSKRTWKLCVRCEGMIVDETSLPTDYENLRSYFGRNYADCEVVVIYEAGFQGFWLHDLLESDGIDCIVTPANKVTQEKDNRVKTDKIDARRLSRNLENGDYSSCWVPDRELREDRQISRTVTQIQRVIVSTKNRIRRFLDFHGLNGALPSGRWCDRRYQELGKLRLSRSLQVCLDIQLGLLSHLQELQDHLLGELRELAEKERYRDSVSVKRSFPGVGWLSAIRFTLEFADVSRFASDKELASWLGLTASEYSSGESIRRGRITRQGRSQVRAWLIECAWTAIRKDRALLEKFLRVWGNSGSKKKAIVAVARKLAGRMRALELRSEPYQVGVVR